MDITDQLGYLQRKDVETKHISIRTGQEQSAERRQESECLASHLSTDVYNSWRE